MNRIFPDHEPFSDLALLLTIAPDDFVEKDNFVSSDREIRGLQQELVRLQRENVELRRKVRQRTLLN